MDLNNYLSCHSYCVYHVLQKIMSFGRSAITKEKKPTENKIHFALPVNKTV